MKQMNTFSQRSKSKSAVCLWMNLFENRALTSLIYDTFNEVDNATNALFLRYFLSGLFWKKALLLNEGISEEVAQKRKNEPSPL